MKKFFTLLLAMVMGVACLGFTACDKKDNGKTLYVYTNAGFAPYEYVNTKGQVVGVDIEMMKEIGSLLGYKVVINDIEFNQILDEVSKNKFAIGAAGMTKTDERDDIALASHSYATSVQYVIAPANSLDAYLNGGKISLADLENLSKKVIGYQIGTTGSYMVDEAINGSTGEGGSHISGDLEGKGFNGIGYSNAIVASGDIGNTLGAVIIDKLPAQSITSANSGLECYELDAEPENYVLYLNKQATELLEDINAVIDVMVATGYVDYLTVKHSGGINID